MESASPILLPFFSLLPFCALNYIQDIKIKFFISLLNDHKPVNVSLHMLV